MAFEKSWHAKTYRAASVINAGQPVAMLGALTPASALDETIVPAGSVNVAVLGVARATVATVGMPVDVDLGGYVKAIAGASLGAGAYVGVGCVNGILVPMAASFAATQMALRYVVGVAEVNAVAADIFTVRLAPAQII